MMQLQVPMGTAAEPLPLPVTLLLLLLLSVVLLLLLLLVLRWLLLWWLRLLLLWEESLQWWQKCEQGAQHVWGEQQLPLAQSTGLLLLLWLWLSLRLLLPQLHWQQSAVSPIQQWQWLVWVLLQL